MDVRPLNPVRGASFQWRMRSGAWAQTFVCKVTYQLRPMTSVLADVQEPITIEDEHWDDDPARSLRAPSDLVPFKTRADVVLVGAAFAPRGEPVRSLVARLQVGEVDKAIEVCCDRVWALDGKLREGQRFTRMPLVYERAAGGPDTRNPVGVRREGPPDRHGNLLIPNLQPPATALRNAADAITPTGFGPIPSTWPERRGWLGPLAGTWPAPGWHEQPMPEGLSPRFYNVAPADQQVDAIRPDERIILENLHRDHPRLVTSLPGLVPRAQLARSGRPAEPVELQADTLWIDTDRGICTVTWRGQILLASRDEPGVVTIDLPGAEHARGGAGDHEQEGEEDVIQTIVPRASPAQRPVPVVVPPTPPVPGAPAVQTMPLPEAPMDDTSVLELSDDALQELSADQTLQPSLQAIARGRMLPFQPVAPAPVTAPAPAPAAQLPPPPPMVWASPTTEPIAPQAAASPWALPEARPDAITVGQSAAGTPAAAGPEPAAKPEPREQPRRERPREILKLLWFDPKALPAIRKHEQWRVTLAELELRLLEEGIEDDDEDQAAPKDGAPNPKDRRDLLEVLARGQAVAADGVRLAIDEAVDDQGRFEPPLILTTADLELPFDELETLKATVTAVTPFAPGDKKLKETLDTVAELLKTPWLSGSGGVAEGLTERVKEAFAQGRRVGPDYLQTHTERMLLEERRYQRRTVYGQTWIRSLLHLGGAPIPTYLPESLAKELPMFKRFRVKLIGEVDLREDQYETHPHAIRAVALARVVER